MDIKNLDSVSLDELIKLKKERMKKTTNTDLYEVFGLPITTQTDWKDRNDYRKKIHLFLKSFTRKELEERLEKALQGVKKEDI
jgi:hypothetical protein